MTCDANALCALPMMSRVFPQLHSFRTFHFVLSVKEHCYVSFGGPAFICCGLVVYSGKMYCMDFLQLAFCMGIFPPKQCVYKCQLLLLGNPMEKSKCVRTCCVLMRPGSQMPALPLPGCSFARNLSSLCLVFQKSLI